MDFFSDQRVEILPTLHFLKPFTLRYGFMKSFESRQSDEKSQDYLAFRISNEEAIFIICDGVSLSFFGDEGAKFLGNKVMDWLQTCEVGSLFSSLNIFEEKLNDWTVEATKYMNKIHIPKHLPPLLREVLESKRQLGSETMMLCGKVRLLDPISHRAEVFIGGLGDIRLRLWDFDRELASFHQPDTKKRWSTKSGVLGSPITAYVSQSPNFNRITVYTDGFAALDESSIIPETDLLQRWIKHLQKLPTSDDTTFLNLSW